MALYFLATKKVQVVDDWRTIDDLRSCFPKVDSRALEVVWKAQRSWSACFDVLSSLVASNQRILIDDCESVFDSVSWPSLPCTMGDHEGLGLGMGDLTDATAALRLSHSVDSEASDWTVIRLDVSETEGDWAMVSPPHFASAAASATGTRTAKSYRDMLLTASTSIVVDVPAPLRQCRSAWRPAILLTAPLLPGSRLRADKVYVCSLKPRAAADAEAELDEQDAAWDICCASAGTSSAVPAKRLHAATRIRPAAMDKKLQRIALKGR